MPLVERVPFPLSEVSGSVDPVAVAASVSSIIADTALAGVSDTGSLLTIPLSAPALFLAVVLAVISVDAFPVEAIRAAPASCRPVPVNWSAGSFTWSARSFRACVAAEDTDGTAARESGLIPEAPGVAGVPEAGIQEAMGAGEVEAVPDLAEVPDEESILEAGFVPGAKGAAEWEAQSR